MRHILECFAHAPNGRMYCACPNSETGLRTRVCRGGTAHAQYLGLFCVCLSSVFVLRMRQLWDGSAHAPVQKALRMCQLAERTAHAPTRRPDYARAFVEARPRMRCIREVCACRRSDFVLRMRQVLDCSTHALVPRLVCACLLAVSDPIGVLSPSYCIRSSVMEAAHALSGLGTSACVIRAPRCRVRSMFCQLVHE